jgi:hypothetical protein
MNEKIGKGMPHGGFVVGLPSEIAVPKSQDWWKHIPDLLD